MVILFIVIAVLASIVYLFMHQASFGKPPSGSRLERIKNSPNYKDGVFQNLSPTPVMAKDASYWELFKKQFESDTNRAPLKPLPSVKNNLKETPSTKPTITWFGHSTYLVQIDGKNILIDPVFSERTSPVQYIGSKNYLGTSIYSAADFPHIDYLFLSHDHYDHLDYGTTLAMKEKVGHYYMPLGVGSHLEYWGLDTAKITEMDWWQEVNITPDIKLVCTPGRHFSGRGIADRGKTLWGSFVLITPTHRIFLGGDSGYDTHFKQIGDKYGPFDIAFLESGQYNAYWPNIHMMPEQTVQANIDLKSKVLMPVHWGKFSLALHPWNEPINRVLNKADELNIVTTTPMIGERVILDSILPNSKWWNLK